MSLQFVFLGGKKDIETVTATAGDAVFNSSPGTGKRWIVLYGIITLVADANAANRYVQLALTDGTNIITAYPIAGTAITAGQTRCTSFGDIPPPEATQASAQTPSAHVTGGHIGIGKAILEGADQLRISIIGGLAGDSFSGYIGIMEVPT